MTIKNKKKTEKLSPLLLIVDDDTSSALKACNKLSKLFCSKEQNKN